MRHVIAFVILTALAAPESSAQSLGAYGGPSILSRGGNRPGQRDGAPVSFRPYVSLLGTYDKGVLPVSVDAAGRLLDLGIYGGAVEVGGHGGKQWQHSSFGVEYRGDFRKYSRRGYFDGSDQALDLVYEKRASRTLSFGVRQLGGTSTRAYGGFIVPAAYRTTDFVGVPTNEIFNNRFYYMQSSGTLSYRRTARTFFSAAGDFFGVHRQSRQLISMTGYRASGQVEHHLSRRTLIGGAYDFMNFKFRRAFGSSDIHGVSILFERRITRRWTLNLQAGGFRIESQGLERIQLDPAIAEILGQSVGVRALYRVSYAPQVAANLSYIYNRVAFNAAYSQGVTPGNGVYLTSKVSSYGAGISYSGNRRFSYGLNAVHSEYDSIFRDSPGKYKADTVSLGGTTRLSTHVSFTGSVGYRRFHAGTLDRRNGLVASIGLTYTPAAIPLSIW